MLLRSFILTGLGMLAAGCGNSSSSAAVQSEAGVADSSQGPPGLFSDPSIPACSEGSAADTQITGTLAGQPFSVQTQAESSQLDANDYYTVDSSGTANTGFLLWHGLNLTWQGALAEEQPVTLTGGYLFAMPDNPQAGPVYCVTSGDFGAEPLSGDAAVGRRFRFRITGARQATASDAGPQINGAQITVDCSGPVVAATLSGCIYRTRTNL
jgi:hypothetical protein